MMQNHLLDDSANRLDPRIARSETAIRTALLEQLTSGRNFTSLTVSEIAEHANVTRKTFYARVGSLEQLVERMVLDLFKEISSQIDDRMLIMPVVGNTLSIMVLGQCEEHKAVLAPLVRGCSASLFMEPLSEVLAHMLARVTEVNQAPKLEPVEQAYLVATIASVIHGVLSVWVKRGFCEAPDRIANFVDTLLVDGLEKIMQAGGSKPASSP